MQVTVETLSPVQRRITVTVPAQQIKDQFESRLAEFAKTVKINGFRPGKVPLSRVRADYGMALEQEVVNEEVRDTLFKAIEQEKIPAVGMPMVEKVDLEGDQLKYSALVDTYPDVQVNKDGLKVDRKSCDLKDEDVDSMLEHLRKQRSTYESRDQPAKKGDQVTFDFKGYIDGQPFDGGEANDFKLVLGSGQMIPGFEDGIEGMKPGEEKKIEVTFPEDYQAKELAGKPATFDIKVKEVAEPQVPEIDDNFLAQLGITEGGVDKLRADVKKNMVREVSTYIRMQNKASAFEALYDANPVEVPRAMIDEEIKRQRERFAAQFAQFGGAAKFDESMLPDSLFEEQAERTAKLGVLLGKLVEANNLQPDAARVDKVIADMAEAYENPQEVIEHFQKNPQERAGVEGAVLEDQLAELIMDSGEVTDTPITYQDLLNQQQGRQ